MMNKIGNGTLGLSTYEQDALLAAYDVIKNLYNTFKYTGIDMLEKSSTGEIIETDELLRVQAILEGLGSDKLSDWEGYKENLDGLESFRDDEEWDEDEDEDNEEDWDEDEELTDEEAEEALDKLLRRMIREELER
jgi:hypothetical protein